MSESRLASSQPVLKATGITAGYGGQAIVEDVSLEAYAGELTAILGPNGAGKSTFLKVLSGVLKPIAGTIVLQGKDVTGLPSQELLRRGISYVPQVDNVFPSLSVVENLEMGAYLRRRQAREKAAEFCEMFPDLKQAWNRPARTLSGGQRTMLAIARGLMLDPKVLLLDEPTAGLAPRLVDRVWLELIKVKNLTVAVVVVEQNTRRTLSQADWANVMVLGRSRLAGTGNQLLTNPEMVELYLGKEQVK